MQKIRDYSLYLVISEEYGKGRNVLEIAKAAIAGGVDIIQMREKNKPHEELVRLGKKLAALCKESGVLFIVNDDPTIAKEAGADGVHIGQEDIKKYPIDKTRKIIGKDRIIGISADSLDNFKKANEEDVDYIGFGPVFPTVVKDRCAGDKDIKEILNIAKKPVVFIGGINISNVDSLLRQGAKNISLIRDIVEAEDITAKVKMFKEKMRGYEKAR